MQEITADALARTMLGQPGSGAHILAAEVGESPDRAAGIMGWDYEVEKVPAYVQDGSYAGGPEDGMPRFKQAKGCFLTRRTDTGAVLGHVGSRYAVQQNDAVLERLKPIVGEGLGRIRVGGVVRNGRRAWCAVEFDREALHRRAAWSEPLRALLFEDNVHPWALFMVNHGGGRSDSVTELPFRLACLNMLPGIVGRSRGSIRHTASIDERWEAETRKLYYEVTVGYKRMAQAYEVLTHVHLTGHVFNRRVLDVALPLTHLPPQPTGRQQAAQDRQIERRGLVRRLWDGEGKGVSGDRTGWDALNAIVEAQDHAESFYPRGNRLRGNLNGHISRTKRKVLSSLMEYAKGQEN